MPQKLKAIADRYAIPAQYLEVEVTETEELENEEVAVGFVDALKAYGFSVSIDDYGTGYSSISFLQQLNLDTLKLDRKFIINAAKTGKARDVMRYLVASMQKNGIRIMCEGIETRDQRDFVVSLNCRFIQGYLYSSPLPKKELEAYLAEHGTDVSDNLDFIPITNFERNRWTGAEDFLTRAMPSWIVSCYVEPGYPIHYISPSFLDGMGYSELECRVATDGLYANLVHPEDLSEILERIDQYNNSDQSLQLQYRLRKKDGSYLWIREVEKRIMTDDGREVMLGVCTDITDMVALQMEKSRIIDTIPGGVGELILTEEGPVIQQAVDRFYDIIGYTREELAGLDNNVSRIIYKQDLPGTMNTLRQILQSDSPGCECSFRIQHKDASLHWVTFRGTISRSAVDPQATVVVYNSDDDMRAKLSAEMAREKLELALASTGQAVFEYDIQTKAVYSHSGFSAYGFEDGIIIDVPGDLLGNGFVHPDDVEKIREVGKKVAAGNTCAAYEARVRSKQTEQDSSYVWIRVTLSTVFDEDGQPVRAVGVVEDISRQKRYEYAFLQEAQYRRAFTESSLMAYEINLSKDTIQRITGSRGFRLQELSNKMGNCDRYSKLLPVSAQYLVAAEDRERFVSELSRESLMGLYKDGITEKEVEYRRLTLDGQELWNAVLTYLVLDQLSGDIMGYVYHRDIHERKLTERGLMNQAARDPLTGVLNRSTAEGQIKEFLFGQANPERVQAFLMLDLDRFKAINDTYGHQVGDKYLVMLTQIVTKQVREADIVARMGGDEFAVLLKNLPDMDTALVISEKLSQAVTGIGKELGIDLATSVSIGIAVTPAHGTDFESLYRHADEAMYQAKQNAGAHVLVYGKSRLGFGKRVVAVHTQEREKPVQEGLPLEPAFRCLSIPIFKCCH